MSTFADTLHPRERTGRFTDKEQSAPELALGADHGLSSAAAALIRGEAPLGATAAHVNFDDDLGALVFSRYSDTYGRSVAADPNSLVDVSLRASNPADLEHVSGVSVIEYEGELRFTIDLNG